MNYSLVDRHRSLRRFLMNALGAPPWTLRTERETVPDEGRPVGVVEVAAPVTTRRTRHAIPQGDVERVQTFAVMLYPELLSTAAESREEAERVAQLLDDAIEVGLVDDAGELLTGPSRIPVYDFAGVPVKGAQRAGPADGYGWLWVEDAPVRALQDPDDSLRWTVTCDLRVSWTQGGRVVAPAPLVGSMPPTGRFGGP